MLLLLVFMNEKAGAEVTVSNWTQYHTSKFQQESNWKNPLNDFTLQDFSYIHISKFLTTVKGHSIFLACLYKKL